jgi:hypothetical protein
MKICQMLWMLDLDGAGNDPKMHCGVVAPLKWGSFQMRHELNEPSVCYHGNVNDGGNGGKEQGKRDESPERSMCHYR